MANLSANCLAIFLAFVPCCLEIVIIKLLFFFSNWFIELILFLITLFNIIKDIIAVNSSAIGNVHQTIFVTLSDKVNKNAIGKTKTTNLNNAVINGFNAYLKAWKTPWIATLIPINIYPRDAILVAFSHTSINSTVEPPDIANNSARGLAIISKIIVIIPETINVSIIPYLIHSIERSLFFIP